MWTWNPICAGHCQHWRRQGHGVCVWTSIFTSSKWGKKRSNYYNQCYTWTRWYFTSLSTVQMAVFLTSQRAFTGHAISLQIPFKLLKIQPASCLLSIILWPLSPHLYFWWKPNFRFLPNQGTLLSEKKKKNWAIYAFDQKHLKCAQKQPSQKEKRTAA